MLCHYKLHLKIPVHNGWLLFNHIIFDRLACVVAVGMSSLVTVIRTVMFLYLSASLHRTSVG